MTTISDTKERSITNHFWQLSDVEERHVMMIMQRFRLPEIVARVIASKDLSEEELEHFISPTIRHLLPDPFHLKDMEKAVARTASAIEKNEHVAIFGDYDVDGATSSAIIKRFMKDIGHSSVTIYIPDRIEEGYGPNSNAMKLLKEQGVSLIITVDCGTLAHEAIDTANACGIDVVVLDHHLGSETLPDAHAVVNPNRLDETSEYRYLAGVGVTFLYLVGLHTRLKSEGAFPSVDLLSYLDLVALGTVCDVVPLKGINRAFVTQGLKILSTRRNIGLRALMDVANIQDAPSCYHLGFILGPRINAGGRVGESSLGSTLLSTENPEEAAAIAMKLHDYNEERKAIEMQVLEEATAQAKAHAPEAAMIIVASEGWHQGVIGIVAGRIKEQFQKPTAVIALENGIGKASARSIAGIDLGSAVVNACHENILLAGGGHAMAAGFSVAEANIDALKHYFQERFEKDVQALAHQATRHFHGYLTMQSLTPRLYEQIEQLGPFGSGNATPCFVLEKAFLKQVDLRGQNVVRCHIEKEGKRTIALAFYPHDSDMVNQLLESQGKMVDIMGKLRLNRWQGRESVELSLVDIILNQN